MHSMINARNLHINPWILSLTLSLFYGFQYILRLLPNVIREDLIDLYQIDAANFGTFSAVYYLGYAIFHIPSGILIDRFGTRHIMLVSVLGCAIGVATPLISHSWALALFGRFLLGAASSPIILGLFNIIQTHFPAHRFSSVLGISVTIGLSGALFGSRPIGILKEWIGWQSMTLSFIAAALALAALFWVLLPSSIHSSSIHAISIRQNLVQLLRNRHIWAVALLSGLMVAPLEGFADAWGVPFFETVYHLDTPTAQTLPSLIFFGFCFGAPVLGYIGEKLQRPYTMMIICGIGMCGIYTILLLQISTDTWWLYLSMIFIGLLCAYQVFMIFINTQVAGPKLAGISSSFTNMVVMSFGTLFHSAIGYTMTWSWNGNTLNNLPIYTENNYLWALTVIPATLLLSGVGFIFIKPQEEKRLFNK